MQTQLLKIDLKDIVQFLGRLAQNIKFTAPIHFTFCRYEDYIKPNVY